MVTQDNELDTFEPIGLAADKVLKRLQLPTYERTKTSVIENVSLLVGNRSLFLGVKGSEEDVLLKSRRVDARSELSRRSSLKSPTYPIYAILARSGFAQIPNGIIRWIAVDVVYLVLGPNPVNVKPSKTVSEKEMTIEPHVSITAAILGACNFICSFPIFPTKDACLWIIGHPRTKQIVTDTFFRFGHVAKVLQNSLNKSEDRADEGSERTQKDDEKRKRDAIAERVAAIEKFERRARGDDAPRRNRKG